MLISEFAAEAGLSVDTVRLYVRRGLLVPKRGPNRYQVFGPDDLRAAIAIRVGRAIGLSLTEIRTFVVESRTGFADAAERIRRIQVHRARLHASLVELQLVIDYMDARVAWLSQGGPEPQWPASLLEECTPAKRPLQVRRTPARGSTTGRASSRS